MTFSKSLQTQARACHKRNMTKAKKAKPSKRDDRVVTYVRVKPEEHAQIAQIAEKRGYPHTIASVASEMISKGLKVETTPRQIGAPS